MAVQAGRRVQRPRYRLHRHRRSPALLPVGTEGGSEIRRQVEEKMGAGRSCDLRSIEYLQTGFNQSNRHMEFLFSVSKSNVQI